MLWESLPREPIRVLRDALQREIVLPAVLPGVVTLPAAERLAARLYADLTALAARMDGGALGRALFRRTPDDPTPESLEDEPWLTLRLVVADVEQLWRDQLIMSAALALISGMASDGDTTTTPSAGTFNDGTSTAHCLLVYRMRPASPVADALGSAGSDRATHAPELTAGARQAPLQLPSRLPRGRLALLLSWTPAIARRSWVFPRSVYTFHWEPVRAIALDRDGSPSADDPGDTDQWTICRLRRPSVPR